MDEIWNYWLVSELDRVHSLAEDVGVSQVHSEDAERVLARSGTTSRMPG